MREIRFIDTSNPKLLKKSLNLVRDAFWEFEAKDYTDDGVLEFSAYIEYDNIAHKMENGTLVMLACFENKRLAGVLAMVPPGHISLLFVAKLYQRRGIARNLVTEMCRLVHKLTAAKMLTVNAPPSTVPVYQKLGFASAGDEKSINGINFVPMYQEFIFCQEE